MSRREFVISAVITLAAVGQILGAFLLYNHERSSARDYMRRVPRMNSLSGILRRTVHAGSPR